MEKQYTKWVATWGNATSIYEQKECRYAKDVSFRYPIPVVFDGSHIRIHFSNITGTEPVTLQATVANSISEREIDTTTLQDISINNEKKFTIKPGEEVVSDEIAMSVKRGDIIHVTIYVEEATQMNSGVLITGSLSRGSYTYGNTLRSENLPADDTRHTSWVYFLNTIDVLTEEDNHALICYGDSLTAQDWPDYLTLRAMNLDYSHVSIIRRAISGTRILREYDCITYAAYGAKGEKRFKREMNVAGADTVIIQHGINDIIHPVGVEENPWRPWEDMPTLEDLKEGYTELYVKPAREMGYKVYAGTLLPIYGWRTYADFREEIKEGFNTWLKESDLFDGCIDFAKAIEDEDPRKMKPEFDSGDHLHPSKKGYEAMANAVPEELINR